MQIGDEDSVICDALKKKKTFISSRFVILCKSYILKGGQYVLHIPVGDRFSRLSFMSFKRCAM